MLVAEPRGRVLRRLPCGERSHPHPVLRRAGDLDLAQGRVLATLGQFTHNGQLAVGGSYDRTADVVLPNGLTGTVFVVVTYSPRKTFTAVFPLPNTS